VEALDRILTRLAMTEDGKLAAVLAKLLPRVLQQLSTPHARVRNAAMSILSHANKRVRPLSRAARAPRAARA